MAVETEPSVLGDRFSAKAENEFTERIPVPGKSYIHKVDVVIIVLVGILYGGPYDHGVRVEHGIGLSFGG